MPSLSSRDSPGAELQAAFRQHLPRRLHVLLRRARAQCRGGWDCNVLRALYDEISLLAGVCGRYGMLETGERLLALESALAPSVAAGSVPDAEATRRIDSLLDGLRPHLQRVVPHAAPAGAPGTGPGEPSAPRQSRPWHWTSRRRLDAAEAGAASDAVSADGLEPESLTRRRVRIVNDDDPLVNTLLLRLDQPDCDVALVDDAGALLALLGRAPPDLSILIADAGTRLDELAVALRNARADLPRPARLLILLREPGAELQLRVLRAGADRCIVLPAMPDDVVNAALELADIDRESAYRVLIVDDDAPQALFAEAVLRHAGMDTRVLGEALPVLAELDRFQPDLLLLDVNMPDCDGFELTALIRERNDYVNTPIVFLSGDQDEERQFAALDAGGDDFLLKPIRPAHLVAAVTNRVRRARLVRARARRASQQDPASRLYPRPQLLGAVSGHLAAGAEQPPAGGLLALEVTDAAVLGAHLGAPAVDRILTDLGTFITAHAPVGSMVARHGDAAYLVFVPSQDETRLVGLARELLDASHGSRFGAHASAITLACAVCAFDLSLRDAAQVLAALEQGLAACAADRPLVAWSTLARKVDATPERLAAALATDSFGLAFQPVFPDDETGGAYYQALLRLRADGHEQAAAELVPVAVEAGLIAAIDAWVTGRCVTILAAHLREGKRLRLSASQVLDGWSDVAGRVASLASQLSAARVPGDVLVLEFQAADLSGRERMLAELEAALAPTGVRLSLAGADAEIIRSGMFDALRPAYVKFAPNLDDDALTAAVSAARARGVTAIATQVESGTEAERLRAAGVERMQGNYFQPPARDFRGSARQVEK